MRSARLLLVGLVAVLALGGCRRPTPRKTMDADGGFTTAPVKEANPPLTPQWKDTEVTFSGYSAIGTFSYNGVKLVATFREVNIGDSIELGGDRATATSSRYMTVQTDMGAQLAKLRPSDAFDYKYRFDPEVKATLTLEGRSLAIPAPSQAVAYALTAAFKKVADTPLAMPLPEKPPAEHTILFTEAIGGGEPIGPAATVDAIDWVAVGTKLPERRGKICTGYKKIGDAGAGDGGAGDAQLVMKDEKLTVYDVRTSKEIGTKDFKASEECPSMTFTKDAPSYPSKDDMKAWLRTLRTKK